MKDYLFCAVLPKQCNMHPAQVWPGPTLPGPQIMCGGTIRIDLIRAEAEKDKNKNH